MRPPVRKQDAPARKPYVRPAWQEHEPTPTTPLQQALRDVCGMAMAGKPPKACAVVYRSLAKEYPDRHWLESYAYQWEQLGDSFYGKNPPKPGNLAAGAGILPAGEGLGFFTEEDMANAERQIERARLAGWIP